MGDSRNLSDKLKDEGYLDSLKPRNRNQLLLCERMLDDNELSNISSIRVGFVIARQRYIETEILPRNPEFAKMILENSRIPIFGIFGGNRISE